MCELKALIAKIATWTGILGSENPRGPGSTPRKPGKQAASISTGVYVMDGQSRKGWTPCLGFSLLHSPGRHAPTRRPADSLGFANPRREQPFLNIRHIIPMRTTAKVLRMSNFDRFFTYMLRGISLL